MAKAKVYIESQEYKVESGKGFKVFFVDAEYKEMNKQIIQGGELVNSDYKADVIVYITDKEHKANIKITRKNFPK